MKLHTLIIAGSALFFCLLNPSWAASRAYITNQGSDNVSVIDTGSRAVIATIPVGKGPVGVAVSAKLNRVYISSVDGQSVSVIDSNTNKVIDQLAIDGSPVGVARAIQRYALAILGFFALGLGFLWALVDRDRQFLHDRLAGTALVDAGPAPAPE